MFPVVPAAGAAQQNVMPLMEEEMLTEDKARTLAAHWIEAWNSHDLNAIMSHYGEEPA